MSGSVATAPLESARSGGALQNPARLKLGPTYLDVLDAKAEAAGGRNSLTRLLLVAALPAGADPALVVQLHERIFDAVLAEEHAAPITGVLITQKDSVLHLIETSMDTSTSFLRHLQAEGSSGSEDLESLAASRILAACEDCPTPYFSKWFHYSVQLQPDASVDIEKEDPVEAAWGVLDKLAELAGEVAVAGGASSGDLKRKYAHLVASNERCLGLSRSAAFMSVGDYLDMYDTPIDIALEGEQSFPLQQTVRY
eukprot:9562-Heterococcus_DN1.PRE.5